MTEPNSRPIGRIRLGTLREVADEATDYASRFLGQGAESEDGLDCVMYRCIGKQLIEAGQAMIAEAEAAEQKWYAMLVGNKADRFK